MTNRQARREDQRANRANKAKRQSIGQPRKSGSGSSGPISTSFFLVVAAVVIVLGVVAAVVLTRTSSSGDADFVKKLEAAEKNFPKDLVNGNKLGKDDAQFKVVAYEDFQCPFCLQYTATQEPDLIEQFVKTGKVQIEFRNLTIIGQESYAAASASMCAADQDKFWEYKHKLFLTQAEAGQFKSEKEDVGRFSTDNLKSFAKQLGLDTAKFNECLDTGAHLETIQSQTREAKAAGISATPGFTINGAALPGGGGAPKDMETWQRAFDTIANAGPTATAAAATAAAKPTNTAAPAAPVPTSAPAPTVAPAFAPTVAPTAAR